MRRDKICRTLMLWLVCFIVGFVISYALTHYAMVGHR